MPTLNTCLTCVQQPAKGEKEDIYLADFLERPLVRRYGQEWYDEFLAACEYVREHQDA